MKQDIKRFLQENSCQEKAQFDRGLIFSKYHIYGVKTSILDKKAKQLAKSDFEINDFSLDSHEGIILAGMTVGYSKLKDTEKIEKLSALLPYLDNWASVDTIAPRLKGLESQREYFENLLEEENVFAKRLGVVFLMKFFLKKDLTSVLDHIERLAKNCREENPTMEGEYYLQMALSWALAEACTVNFDQAKKSVESISHVFIRNKAIQKARESFRLTSEQKEMLKDMKLR